jgi:hypothetical protein
VSVGCGNFILMMQCCLYLLQYCYFHCVGGMIAGEKYCFVKFFCSSWKIIRISWSETVFDSGCSVLCGCCS